MLWGVNSTYTLFSNIDASNGAGFSIEEARPGDPYMWTYEQPDYVLHVITGKYSTGHGIIVSRYKRMS